MPRGVDEVDEEARAIPVLLDEIQFSVLFLEGL